MATAKEMLDRGDYILLYRNAALGCTAVCLRKGTSVRKQVRLLLDAQSKDEDAGCADPRIRRGHGENEASALENLAGDN